MPDIVLTCLRTLKDDHLRSHYALQQDIPIGGHRNPGAFSPAKHHYLTDIYLHFSMQPQSKNITV